MDKNRIGQICTVGQEFYIKSEEGMSISFEEGFLQFIICFDDIKEEEIRRFKENKFEIKLLEVNSEIFFLLNIDGFIENSIIAYTPALTENLKVIPAKEGEGYLIKIFLVQQESNILKAMRLISISNEMSNEFNRLIKNYNFGAFDIDTYTNSMYKSLDQLGNEDYINKHIISTYTSLSNR